MGRWHESEPDEITGEWVDWLIPEEGMIDFEEEGYMMMVEVEIWENLTQIKLEVG